jgi:hypothetical protein
MIMSQSDQQGKEHIVVERQASGEILGSGDSGTQPIEMVQVPTKVGEPFNQERHRVRLPWRRSRIRLRNGSRSAARSCTSRRNA